ncbi:MAG: TIGR01777 family oxidoreductase [Chitinophagales bacterium]
MQKVLITGGSGLIGTRLSQLLLQKGFAVAHLSRSNRTQKDIEVYQWDLKKKTIDEAAIATADYIVHLAGAGVADKRWSDSRKKEIIDSRIQSANLLYESLQKVPNQVKAFIGSSGISYYGDSGKEVKRETAAKGTGFLSDVTEVWEEATFKMSELNLRTVAIRTGLVLSTKGGALAKIALPVKFGVGTYFGDGQHYYSWIHIDDLCNIYIKAIEDESMDGIYNGVAPNPVTNKDFVLTIAKALHRPKIAVPVPEFGLRLGLGEMADAVLEGINVSSEKIEGEGFVFDSPTLLRALKDVYEREV